MFEESWVCSGPFRPTSCAVGPGSWKAEEYGRKRSLLSGDFSWPARLSQQSSLGHLSKQLVLKSRKRIILQCGNT